MVVAMMTLMNLIPPAAAREPGQETTASAAVGASSTPSRDGQHVEGSTGVGSPPRPARDPPPPGPETQHVSEASQRGDPEAVDELSLADSFVLGVLRGFSLLQAAGLNADEKRDILSATKGSLEFETITRALQTLWDEQFLGRSHAAPYYQHMFHDAHFTEDADESDWWWGDYDNYWADATSWSWDDDDDGWYWGSWNESWQAEEHAEEPSSKKTTAMMLRSVKLSMYRMWQKVSRPKPNVAGQRPNVQLRL